MKEAAYLKALNVIDAVWSHMNWEGVKPDQQPYQVAQCREALNGLIIFGSPEVVKLYMRCIGMLGKVKGSDIGALRTVIRLDLGLLPVQYEDEGKIWLAKL